MDGVIPIIRALGQSAEHNQRTALIGTLWAPSHAASHAWLCRGLWPRSKAVEVLIIHINMRMPHTHEAHEYAHKFPELEHRARIQSAYQKIWCQRGARGQHKNEAHAMRWFGGGARHILMRSIQKRACPSHYQSDCGLGLICSNPAVKRCVVCAHLPCVFFCVSCVCAYVLLVISPGWSRTLHIWSRRRARAICVIIIIPQIIAKRLVCVCCARTI